MSETTRRIEVPEVGLVVLCGASGSGKSTFARRHFAETEVVSSDRCRAMVGDDETDQSVTGTAFDLLHTIVDKRLELGRLTVVDATNIKAEDRRPLIQLGRKWDVLTTAIVFDLPLDVCLERNGKRTDRVTPEHAIKRQQRNLRRSLKKIGRERFSRIHSLTSVGELEAVEFGRTKLWNDRRDDSGPFDIIGDVHGCADEMVALLAALGYQTSASPIRHPDGRRALFLGDLVDRGPGNDRVLETVMEMVDHGSALCILGNHENKLGRALAGRNVTVTHGLAESLDQLGKRDETFRNRVKAFIDGLVSHYVLDGGKLVVAHAGLPERYHGRASGRVRSIALYGDTDGETDEYGLPIRYPWAEDYRGDAAVVYGHTPVPDSLWINNTICIDNGAVFGGKLTALRWPERELVSVDAAEEYYEPTRPLVAEPADRRSQLLDVGDVLGKHHVETTLARRVTVDADRSSAALEVMSRFAVDPRWLIHLPPTMAPVATSARPDYLEHPDEAFAYFAASGVRRVVCQEKHMGSRALVMVAKTPDEALEVFGITNDAGGVVVTRTGRPFFADEALGTMFVNRVRAAIDGAGLWHELETNWMLIDTEILPWSVKAGELLQRQYAATGAAGVGAMAAADDLTRRALARGVAVDDLAERSQARGQHLAAYRDTYRAYCWPVDGLSGVQIAPFQILAAEGEVLARRAHTWHLEQLDRLVEQDPEFVRRTERRVVDLDVPDQVADAVGWWTEMTNGGGEGMVVKPDEPIVQGEKDLVLPGVKCRGREYLRIIYGPEYLVPANLERLRQRSLRHKSSMARREFALGIEALDRFVGRQHLQRVHECVFAVLALESEPVDPRL